MTSLEFIQGVKAHIEALGSAGPFTILENNHNPIDGVSYSALVRVWEGNTNDAVTRNFYRFWLANDGITIRKAKIAKTELPAGY